jgi:NAD(P)-dependent dehydrogenase (short-subunit alcohol dehydrogenase family)
MTGLTFSGQVALVTGAGRGIGRAHALELARRGARVVFNDPGGAVTGAAGDQTAGGGVADPAEAVAAEIRASGGDAIASHDSVATPDGGAAIAARAPTEFGQLDIVVHNAGLTAEVVRDRLPENIDPEGAIVPRHIGDELGKLGAALQAAPA